MDLIFIVETFVYLLFYVNVVFMGSAYLFAKLFRIQVKEIDLFVGKVKQQHQLFGTRVNRKTIPINSSIAFLVEEDLIDGSAHRIGDQKTLNEATHLQRAILALAGLIGLSVIAAVLLGPDAYGRHVIIGVGQIVHGALSPCSVGAEYVAKFFLIHDASIIQAFAVLATKQIAFAVFPIYGTPIHAIIHWPLRAAFPTSRAERISHAIGITFIFLALIPVTAWTLALLTHAAPTLTQAFCTA